MINTITVVDSEQLQFIFQYNAGNVLIIFLVCIVSSDPSLAFLWLTMSLLVGWPHMYSFCNTQQKYCTVLVGPICLAHSQTNIYLHLCCYSVLVVHLKKCFLNRSCSLQLPIIPLHCPSYSRNINCVRHGYVARLSSSRDFTL